MSDSLGKFLYEQGVAPDDFKLFRERIQSDGLAVIKLSGGMLVLYGEDGESVSEKVGSEAERFATMGIDFSVNFYSEES